MSGPISPIAERWAMTAFGMDIAADLPLPGATARRHDAGAPDLMIRRVARGDLEGLVDSPRYMRYLHSYEGCGYAMLEGEDGDVLFHYRERALFHLVPDRRVLRCAVSESGTAWQRVLLDTVLWTVSLLQGYELLHASAVATAHGLVALVGPSGAGKTTLAIELMRRGGVLFADDIVALKLSGEEVVAHPGPPLMNVPGSVGPFSPDGWDVLAEVGDERWVAVRREAPDPQPIRTVVFLAPGSTGAECVVVPATSVTTLPHLVTFTHLHDRRRQQFEVASGVAAGAAVVKLSRSPGDEPHALLDLVCACLGADRVAPTTRTG